MKSTAIAPSNIAFIKYWGKKNEQLRLPANGSVSMNLSQLITTTTVEFSDRFKNDLIEINKNKSGTQRVTDFINRIRKLAKLNYKVKVVSQNNFPIASGLASSASGFAALTLSATTAAGLKLPEKELSILARIGSGSACRSVPDGFVEWLEGETSETSYALSLYPPTHWAIADVVAIVNEEKKETSSTRGHELARTSPFFAERLVRIKEKIKLIKKYIKDKQFKNFGELIEAEALEMHAIMFTSTPALLYWRPTTIEVMKAVQKWRQKGLSVYFTIDAGPHPHLICQKENAKEVVFQLKSVKGINRLIVNYPAVGARLSHNHLF